MVNDDPKQFQERQDSDQMVVPFQYNICQFMNVKKCLLCIGNVKDNLLLVCLHCVILDSIWSKERSPVQENLNLVRSLFVDGKVLGLEFEVYPVLGLFSIGDQSEVEIAYIIMIQQSGSRKKKSKTIQFETLCKLFISKLFRY